MISIHCFENYIKTCVPQVTRQVYDLVFFPKGLKGIILQKVTGKRPYNVARIFYECSFKLNVSAKFLGKNHWEVL